ncbi:uncharacterized protein [Dysidea avara]|uniref:uncharacterized protein n=1 Tax=Dysidea avara TaxID=196820 RepID=UPI003324CE0C
MSDHDAKDYDTVKAAIFRRYDINEETTDDDSDLAEKWLKGRADRQAVVDELVKEQFVEVLPEEIKVWVNERKPRTSEEAGRLAEDYRQARKGDLWVPGMEPKKSRQRTCFTCKQPGHLARDCPTKVATGVSSKGEDATKGETAVKGERKKREDKPLVCYNCGGRGYTSRQCPSGSFYCGARNPYKSSKSKFLSRCEGMVEGQLVSDIVLDTGCSRTLVHSDLVSDEKLRQGEAVTVQCAHGDTVVYPLANMELEVHGQAVSVEVVVSEILPQSVLLGTDVPELLNLLRANDGGQALMVVTRRQALAQAAQLEQGESTDSSSSVEPVQEPEVATGQPEEQMSVSPSADSNEQFVLSGEFDFGDDMFVDDRAVRSKKSRSDKRKDRYEWACLKRLQEDIPNVNQSKQELRKLQDEVLGIRDMRERSPKQFVEQDGLLYHVWTPKKKSGEAVEQLVLPEQFHQIVCKLAHTIPLAGHLGRDKTVKRISRRFFWPALFRDVADYCRRCPECQRTAKGSHRRVPLIPPPIMKEPFERIALDIIGPLPRSRRGNQHILVVCDYATRYPEAMPLRSIDAGTVAEHLIQLFARVGIPREILSDQGTNFMSQLLKELYNLLRIHQIRTSPYHPQTDGLDTTGFSPFELLYGREVRSPLDVLKEVWEANKKSDESVASHILLVRERLEEMTELVEENVRAAQGQQKKWYDQTARQRELQPDEEVLVLLPNSSNKLLAQWQGPYRILRRVGKVNYEVLMPNKRKRKNVFQVNMLKKWYPPVATSFWLVEQMDMKEYMPTWKCEGSDAPIVSDQLSKQQLRQLYDLLAKFKMVMSSKCGWTSVCQHHIHIRGDTPVRQQPYRLPHVYREAVEKVVETMLAEGIIEPCSSEWASPVVVVKKKDNTIRLCVDYRRLNAVTRVDAYPMPRVDDILDKVGQARYISTLDLAKGYWQVPVAVEDRPKTAFITPQGLYQLRMMPFGLCGAPATFQRMMDHVIRGMNKFASAYLNDLFVFSSSWEDHLEHLQAVLKRLQSLGLTAKPSKCQLAMTECKYLGHVVGNGVVKPERGKLQAIAQFPLLTTKKQVRSFLGLTGYYIRFIPHYATIATPLTNLTRKSVPEHTDASEVGVGAVLSQQDDQGHDHPVSFFSKKLLPREQRFSTVEKECLAVKLGIEAFEVYLLGRQFVIQTDHRALQWLTKFRNHNSRLMRWSLALQPYIFQVQHRKGTDNANADTLSRLPYWEDVSTELCDAKEGGRSVIEKLNGVTLT